MSSYQRRIVGKCSQCGGVVSVPTIYHSVKPPTPSCERCGAVADQTANLPVIPTRGGRKVDDKAWDLGGDK